MSNRKKYATLTDKVEVLVGLGTWACDLENSLAKIHTTLGDLRTADARHTKWPTFKSLISDVVKATSSVRSIDATLNEIRQASSDAAAQFDNDVAEVLRK